MRLRSLKPKPHTIERIDALPAISRFIAGTPAVEILWLSDGVDVVSGKDFVGSLARALDKQTVTIVEGGVPVQHALTAADNAASALTVKVLRASTNGGDTGLVRALDPKTMTLRGASVHRIEKKDRDAAIGVTAASSSSKPPLARLLASPTPLTDGKAETAWSEQKSGDGHGEFVSMQAPIETPLHSLLVTTATTGAVPRSFFVATDAKLFRVTIPEDKTGAMRSGFTQPPAASPRPRRSSSPCGRPCSPGAPR